MRRLSACQQRVEGLRYSLLHQGLELVKYILPFGWSLALFDYRGSGISDGEYTSMGVT
jgi:hypothetical protein